MLQCFTGGFYMIRLRNKKYGECPYFLIVVSSCGLWERNNNAPMGAWIVSLPVDGVVGA